MFSAALSASGRCCCPVLSWIHFPSCWNRICQRRLRARLLSMMRPLSSVRLASTSFIISVSSVSVAETLLRHRLGRATATGQCCRHTQFPLAANSGTLMFLGRAGAGKDPRSKPEVSNRCPARFAHAEPRCPAANLLFSIVKMVAKEGLEPPTQGL